MSNIPRQSEHLAGYSSIVEEALRRLEEERAIHRIWERDSSLWKEDAAHQKIIGNSLGWLSSARLMMERVGELQEFADEVRRAGFTHLMLLGMGGSSLCPEVLRRTFGLMPGYPELLVLDTTDPDTIYSFEEHLDKRRTLFIVASKSGTTIEPLSFYKYFYDRVRRLKGEKAGENFVAITDPGTLMERMAKDAGFRRIFLNPSDIGGRYSALSYFGMVPAALMGLDVKEMLTRALQVMEASGASVPAVEHQAARLGATLGALAQEGRDKLTLVADPLIGSLGLWIEQLVAESTGKEGRGIVPVAGEPFGDVSVYGDDRVFVSICVGGTNEETDRHLTALEERGYPVVRRTLNDPLDLCAEFFVWEYSTAVAGHLMKINPFDQPNVQESKDNTNRLLDEFKTKGALPEEKELAAQGNLTLKGLSGMPDEASYGSLAKLMAQFLAEVESGDYLAILAYIQESNPHDELLQEIRTYLRDSLRVATTTGYGPRFLHSTGQLHKGGSNEGVFIQLTDKDATDLEIPGEPYSFSTLKQAQALGDFSSLSTRERRAVRLHLGEDAGEGLKSLLELLRAAVSGAIESSRGQKA